MAHISVLMCHLSLGISLAGVCTKVLLKDGMGDFSD